VRARQGYAAALVFDLLRSRGLAADLLSQARLDPQAGLILGQTCLLAPAVLEDIFASASLARELATGHRDDIARFDERAITWDLTRPWVDLLAGGIADTLCSGRGESPAEFKVIITHDVDRTTACEFTSLASAVLKLTGLRRAHCLPRSTVLSRLALARHVERILAFEQHQGVGACYFMMAGPYGLGRHGTRTDIRWAVSREIAGLVRAAGMTVGLHGSFAAAETGSYGEEKDRLEQVVGVPVTAHRNHYLRFDPLRMVAQLETAGIAYDFGMGFTGRFGFRAGLGSLYRAFDWSRNQPARLRLVPLLFMDNLLLASDIEVVFQSLVAALREVQAVGGCVSLLFHPESFLVEPRTWTFFERVIGWCHDQGADLSGKLLPASGGWPDLSSVGKATSSNCALGYAQS